MRDVIIPNKIKEIVVWQDYLSNPLLTMDEFAVSEHWLKQVKIPVRKLDLSAPVSRNVGRIWIQIDLGKHRLCF